MTWPGIEPCLPDHWQRLYPLKDIIVVSDASNLGLGVVILHKENNRWVKAVAHASKILLPVEKGYSQIEKEALGIIFALKKFHRFIHGRNFMLQMDHQPVYFWLKIECKILQRFAIAAKAPPVKFTPWSKTNKSWSRWYIDLVGPMKGRFFNSSWQFLENACGDKM